MSGETRDTALGGESKKPKKAGTLVSAFIEKTAYDALLKHCESTGQSKTKAIERAIMSYCKRGEADNGGNGREGAKPG